MKNLIIVLSVLLTSCAAKKSSFAGTPFEKFKDTKEAGFNNQNLLKLTEYIKSNSPTTGLLVLKEGKVAYEYGDLEKISYIASCRKSVMSMLYGKYVENGTIDLDETIGSIGIDEKDGLLEIEKSASVDNIITSRSGVFHVAANAGYDKDNILERGSKEPGDYFVYNNWDFNVAGAILEIKSGNSVYEEMEEQFAIPLGFQDWNIENQKKSGNKSKSQYQAYHFYLSTRDMAKIGQLMLNEGVWDGKELISTDWITKTTSTVTPFETMVERYGPADPDGVHMSYGYMWWLIDNFRAKPAYEDAYTAIGYGGQFITVLPAVDIVIAHKTNLNLLTKIGITYKSADPYYWEIVDQIVGALE